MCIYHKEKLLLKVRDWTVKLIYQKILLSSGAAAF